MKHTLEEFPIKEYYNYIVKTAKNGGNSARVFVPLSWKDKKVAVLLLEPVDGDEEKK
jgi:hypothetical protein